MKPATAILRCSWLAIVLGLVSLANAGQAGALAGKPKAAAANSSASQADEPAVAQTELSGAGAHSVASLRERMAPLLAWIPSGGKHAPLESAVAQVETVLSTNNLFAWVEREQVRRVLTEQQLTAAGLGGTEQAAKLGQLLAADLFVFVERLPQDTNQTWRIEIIESRTGIALGHLVAAGGSLVQDPAPLVKAILAALGKSQVPLAQRHYLGVLGFRSEEIGRALDPLASLLEAWLPFDLATASNVVLLDRKHLDRLASEEHLSGLELQLKSSAVLVQGTLKRVPRTQQLLLRLGLQSPGALTVTPLTLTLAPNDLPGLRRAVAAAVFDELHVAKPTGPVLEPAREAALFSERANLHHLDGEYEAATQAAEAALALDPTFETRMRAAELYDEAGSRQRNRADVVGVPREQRGQPRLSPAVNLDILRHAVRAAELHREAVDLFLAEARRQPSPTNAFPHTTRGSGFLRHGLQLPLEPVEHEATELRHEVQRHSVALFRLKRDYYAALWNASTNGMKPSQHPQWQWSYLLADSLPALQEWTDDVKQWTNLLGEVVAHYQNPPGSFTVHDQGGGQPSRSIFWYYLPGCLLSRKFNSTEDQRIMGDLLESFARQPSPALRLAARCAKVQRLSAADRKAARPQVLELLDDFVRDYPYDHPVRRQDDDYWFPSIRSSLFVMNLNDFTMMEHYGRAILQPILRARDGPRLCSWSELLARWLAALEHNGKSGEAFAWSQLALELVQPDLQLRGSGAVAHLRPRLSQIRDRLTPPEFRLSGAWAGWKLMRLASNDPPTVEMLASQFQPDQLLALWLREEDTDHVVLQLTTQPLTGGPKRTMGDATIKAIGMATVVRRAVVFAADATMACVGTGAGGLVVFRDGSATRFTETNGLPDNNVRAVACLNGEVYLGFPEGLAALNPVNGRVTELAARRSTEQRGPFDGQPFHVLSFLADPERQCVWMSFFWLDGGRPGSMHGLWKYTPKARSFEKLFMAPRRPLGPLSLQRGHLVAAVDWPGRPAVVAVNPQSGEATWLLNMSVNDPETPRFGLAVEGEACWLWRGDELLSGGAMLSRRTRSQPVPAILSMAPDGSSLSSIVGLYEPRPGQILFATARGELWQLQPPNASPAIRPDPVQDAGFPDPASKDK